MEHKIIIHTQCPSHHIWLT